MEAVPISAPASATGPASDLAPPLAPARPREFTLHGEHFVDDYAWRRDRDDPSVHQYLEAENAYTDRVLAPLRELEATLYSETLGRIKQTDLTVPYREGAHWYY